MKPYYADDSVTLHHGDCVEVLRTLPDSSVDAVVTDPPYELGFMGRAWDASGIAYSVDLWREAWRVLKPGGHLLAFGGTRTVHRLTCAVEDAGFEIRDGIDWLYASGFPKSLDVSKAIDKRPGVGRHAEFAAHLTARREAAGLTCSEVAERIVGSRTGACWNWEHHQFPEAKWWTALRNLLGLDEAWGTVIAEADRQRIGTKRAGLHHTSGDSVSFTRSINRDADGALPVTAPATDAAARWSGWGTALKPAREPIVVARKPLAGTVAANVLAYGTGAVNIDACRVAAGQDYRDKCASVVGLDSNRNGDAYGEWTGVRQDSAHAAGRWPSNVVLSHAPDCEPDEYECVTGCPVAEMGEPSRFFPVFRFEAKAPTSERPRVNGEAHATVKPLDLMRWLVRLVTPPGGMVLEPFAGSGTTAEACVLEGLRCIAIEREAAYLPLIVARLSKPLQPALDFGAVA